MMPRPRALAASNSSRPLRIFIIHGSQYLTDHFLNGDGLVAWGFVSELARRGHRVYVATDKLDVKAAIPPNLTLVEFPRVKANSALHYLSYMRQVRSYYERLAASERIDVVHQMNPVVRGLSLALLGKRVPVVLGTYVGDWAGHPSFPNFKKPTFALRLQQVAKAAIDGLQQHYASSLILATPHAFQRVAFPPDVAQRIEFLHHGVDTVLYSPKPAPNDPPPIAKRILYVGSLQIKKGVLTLADAFALVAAEIETATLVVVGDGASEAQMKARLEALGVANRSTFVGRQSRKEVAAWMRSCDVLCAPSFAEPYGQNVLEAMATGKPVVLSTVGGHRFIGDDEGTIAVQPGNVAKLAAALAHILNNHELALKMGHHNRRVAEARHAWPTVVNRLEKIYARAIDLYTRTNV